MSKERVELLTILTIDMFESRKDSMKTSNIEEVIGICDEYYDIISKKTDWNDPTAQEYQLTKIKEIKKRFVDELNKRAGTQTSEETATNQ